MKTSPVLHFENISLWHQGANSDAPHCLFHKLHLSLPAGQTSAILGRSGSGKSSLLKIVNGILKPDSGKVHLAGQLLNYKRKKGAPQNNSIHYVGYMIQSGGLFPHLRVHTNISLKARLLGWDKQAIQKRLNALFALVELPLSYLSRYPHQLSGGEQQRVSLCRALMLQPKLLLLDEPFSALDPSTRSSIQNKFKEIQEELKLSVVLVTHSPTEAKLLGSYIVLLNQGKVEHNMSAKQFWQSSASKHLNLGSF